MPPHAGVRPGELHRMNVTDKGFDYACFNRPYWRQWFERVMNADERLQEIERAQLEALLTGRGHPR